MALATFKADVLKMIDNGQSVPCVAQALVISEALIYNRDGGPLEIIKQREEKHRSLGHASDVVLENQRLLQRISQLEVECEFLKKARRVAPLSIISRQI